MSTGHKLLPPALSHAAMQRLTAPVCAAGPGGHNQKHLHRHQRPPEAGAAVKPGQAAGL